MQRQYSLIKLCFSSQQITKKENYNALLETNSSACHHIYVKQERLPQCTEIPTSQLLPCCYSMQQFITIVCLGKSFLAALSTVSQ